MPEKCAEIACAPGEGRREGPEEGRGREATRWGWVAEVEGGEWVEAWGKIGWERGIGKGKI